MEMHWSMWLVRSSAEGSTPGVRRDRPSRAKTRDEIYAMYCTFGEKKHPGGDFLSKILNVLRESVEGMVTHAEVNHLEHLSILISSYFPNSFIIKRKVHDLWLVLKPYERNSMNMRKQWWINWDNMKNNVECITNDRSMVCYSDGDFILSMSYD